MQSPGKVFVAEDFFLLPCWLQPASALASQDWAAGHLVPWRSPVRRLWASGSCFPHFGSVYRDARAPGWLGTWSCFVIGYILWGCLVQEISGWSEWNTHWAKLEVTSKRAAAPPEINISLYLFLISFANECSGSDGGVSPCSWYWSHSSTFSHPCISWCSFLPVA